MATFVLVHGANLGGWCWRLVTPALRHAGHEVFAPSLTGCGDRKHLLSPEVGLETWIDDIANLIYYEDLDNVVLVGHSNGCAVVSGVADRMPGRIAHAVYLDGAVLYDGESIWGLIPEDARAWMERQLAAAGSTWSSPPAPPEAWVEMARAAGWNEVVARWAGHRATAEPLKPGRDPIRLKGSEAVAKLARTYVRCIALAQRLRRPDARTLPRSRLRARRPGCRPPRASQRPGPGRGCAPRHWRAPPALTAAVSARG